MFISGKEVITVDNKEFIRVTDAMQVIAPAATNASRWFRQHQELFSPETFGYSDGRFPGREGHVWLTVPEGFQALAKACMEAPRLKVPDGVEARTAPFLLSPLLKADSDRRFFTVDNHRSLSSTGDDDGEGHLEITPFSNGVSIDEHAEGGVTAPIAADKELMDKAQSTSQAPEGDTDDVDIEFDVEGVVPNASHPVEGGSPKDISKPTQPKGIVYQEPQERMYMGAEPKTRSEFTDAHGEGVVERIAPSGLSATLSPRENPAEEWVDLLTHTISDLVARYHAKMGWLEKINKEAPVEIHNSVVDLFATLHDKLVDDAIDEILKFKVENPVNLKDYPDNPYQWDSFSEYLAKGYEISFEAEGDKILCRIQSGAVAVETTGKTWLLAFEKADEVLSSLGR